MGHQPAPCHFQRTIRQVLQRRIWFDPRAEGRLHFTSWTISSTNMKLYSTLPESQAARKNKAK
jgi:hypothetical protein